MWKPFHSSNSSRFQDYEWRLTVRYYLYRNYALSSIPLSLQRLVFWHQEVASDSFCFLINSSWLLVFILYVFSLFLSGLNLYCWKGIHFSQNLDLNFSLLFFNLIISFHFWFRDLLRENQFSILWTSLFINVYYRWLNRNNSWNKCLSHQM